MALRNRAGEAWGCLGLYREPGENHFNRDEMKFLRAAAPIVGEGVRRALLIGEARDQTGRTRPVWSCSPRSSKVALQPLRVWIGGAAG